MKLRSTLLILTLLWMVTACSLSSTPQKTPSPVTNTALPQTWTTTHPGVEYRTITVNNKFDMVVVRLDPAQVYFRVHYYAGDPPDFSQWRTELANAVVFVNGNFFDENNQAIGLVVSDGNQYGYSLVDFGGMFEIDTNGMVRMRSLVQEPYQGEFLQQAVQGFPMLVKVGGVRAPTGEGFDVPSRRTIIAQDMQGRILLMSTGISGTISLNDLQVWLLGSDLEINVAFNLDGGRSTALVLTRPGQDPLFIPPASDLPIMLAVYAYQ
ncbi:MAG: phosphodiester glycosidase family protein [Chloroflexi bacterium]|nr:phosphodiester glycosidase family protein [Chloroflexota bacterium]